MARDPRIRKDDPRKAQLIRAKIQDNVILSQDRAELAKVEDLISRGQNAYVRVAGYVYPKVKITVQSRTEIVMEKEFGVEYILVDDNIVQRDFSITQGI